MTKTDVKLKKAEARIVKLIASRKIIFTKLTKERFEMQALKKVVTDQDEKVAKLEEERDELILEMGGYKLEAQIAKLNRKEIIKNSSLLKQKYNNVVCLVKAANLIIGGGDGI